MRKSFSIKKALKATTVVVVFVSVLFSSLFVGPVFADPQEPKLDVFVDTDPGVSDSFALAWLLDNPDINLLGISTVYGNTSAENGAKNVLTLMDVMNRHDVPVYIGATAPLVRPTNNIGMLIHGFDGIWGQQTPQDISGLSTDAPAAIAEAARNHPGMILLALGPATNVALAAQRFPTDMQNAKIYMGAEVTGNEYDRVHSDPFSGGFNTWIDPHAVDVVLQTPGLDFTIYRGGSYDGVTVDSNEYGTKLLTEGGAVGQFLAAMAIPSWMSATQGAGGPVVLDDLILSITPLKERYIMDVRTGVGKVSTHEDFTAGTYYFASDPNSKVALIATPQELSDIAFNLFTDPNFNLQLALFLILSRQPDNMNVVVNIDTNKVHSEVNSAFSN